jgi:hypothetical protein
MLYTVHGGVEAPTIHCHTTQMPVTAFQKKQLLCAAASQNAVTKLVGPPCRWPLLADFDSTIAV